jgi:hypothetical protein
MYFSRKIQKHENPFLSISAVINGVLGVRKGRKENSLSGHFSVKS